MYAPKHFAISDIPTIHAFIRENSFATLVSVAAGTPIATHIPIELETNEKGETVLWGHVAKANSQCKTFQPGARVLVIFLAPVHHYISSSWYNYVDAPTWNYMSVHITGTIQIIEGEKTKESVRRLMNKYEKESAAPLAFDSLPPDVLQQLNGLVAFEVQIEKTEAVFKMSQNRDDENYQRIVHQLKANGSVAARLMAEALERQR